MKIRWKSWFGIILVAEITALTATARPIDFGDISTRACLKSFEVFEMRFNLNRQVFELRLPVVGVNNPGTDIAYSPGEQSPASPEVQPRKSGVLRLLMTAVVFVVCILVVGAALRKHQCCCGRKKFPY